MERFDLCWPLKAAVGQSLEQAEIQIYMLLHIEKRERVSDEIIKKKGRELLAGKAARG